ncbi:50S ribosomal protein L25/general stress protein Ctc [Marinoscillum sp. MHG1-6]|uniref:50S ribosomal protein L25/general stress protein Ctc n=1 Tax=Marinoscillum sp. MHG1-6 TaxID=2959627 RepID=UPI0021580104|nr:50S ribosomal protein L25/general stress protein Ctc [Marinoscillum sp. MHG1-6]
MKTVEIIGYKRANLGKTESKRLRAEGYVPGVLYGGEEQIHFYAPGLLFREIVYTDEAHFVELNIEGQKVRAILQDLQFHPVSEAILHVDFLELHVGTPVKMDIPIHTVGQAAGVKSGGKLIKKVRFLSVRALPKNMPEHIEIDVTKLGLGKTIKVGEIPTGDYEILNSPLVSVVGVEIPRALRGKTAAELEGEEGEEEGAEAESAEA